MITARYQQQAPVLIERLQRLYGASENFADWYTSLMVSVARVAAERPAALRDLDQQRQHDSNWFAREDMLGYCTYVDKFAGTLQGVHDKIPHLSEMGVRYLHLLPFLRARAGDNDGGFAVASFSEIEARFGTMTDLRQLTASLRQAKISLCSDFILNHVADEHPWALAAKAGDRRYRDYFYSYQTRTEPDRYEQTLGQIFPQAAPGNFTYIKALQRWVWTTFYPYQWDLNYRNPAVFAEMADALLRLANEGIEVFRLDSTAFLWKREGSSCMNQPEAHWILQALRCLVDIAAPGVLLKAEAIVATADLPAYLGSVAGVDRIASDVSSEVNVCHASAPAQPVKECHLAYHSSLMAAGWAALAEQDTGMIARVMQGTPALPGQTSWLTYVRCHDDIGWNVLRAEASAGSVDSVDSIGSGDRVRPDVPQRLSAVSRFFAGADGSFARGASFQASDPAAVHGTVGMASALCGYASSTDAASVQLAHRRLLLMYGLALTFGGLPVIYMGDELAQGNDDSYRLDPAKSNDSRWLQRPDLDQVAYDHRHDTSSQAGLAFASLCRMLACRRHIAQLAATQARRYLAQPQRELLVFARGDVAQHETLYFVGNFSDHAVTLPLQTLSADLLSSGVIKTGAETNWIDLLSEKIYPGGGSAQVTLAPFAQLWLRLQVQGETA